MNRLTSCGLQLFQKSYGANISMVMKGLCNGACVEKISASSGIQFLPQVGFNFGLQVSWLVLNSLWYRAMVWGSPSLGVTSLLEDSHLAISSLFWMLTLCHYFIIWTANTKAYTLTTHKISLFLNVQIPSELICS